MYNRVLKGNPLPRIMDDWQKPSNSSSTINININIVNASGTSPYSSRNRGGTMKTVVVLSPGEDGYIVAKCPTLPGCMSQGKTREEAIENVREAIELCREVLHEQGIEEFEVVELEV